MRAIGRFLLLVIVLGAAGTGLAYFLAGRQPGPAIDIRSPEKLVGQVASLEFAADAPGGHFTTLTAVLDQDGVSETLFALDAAGARAT